MSRPDRDRAPARRRGDRRGSRRHRRARPDRARRRAPGCDRAGTRRSRRASRCPRLGCATSDLMIARMFLTRWFSSSLRMRWRSSDLARSSASSSLWRSTISTRATRVASAISRSLVRPGRGLAAHRLLPDREALARRQPVAERAGLVGLFRVAGPVEGAHELLAEEEQIVARPLRQGNRRARPRPRRNSPRPSGRCAAEALRRPDAALGDRCDKARRAAGTASAAASRRGRSSARAARSPTPSQGTRAAKSWQIVAAGSRRCRSPLRRELQETVEGPPGPRRPPRACASASSALRCSEKNCAEHLGGDALGHGQACAASNGGRR